MTPQSTTFCLAYSMSASLLQMGYFCTNVLIHAYDSPAD
jgi:hypothetical protein